MYTILFVDDEPNILSGIKRMLRSMRSEWDMLFATSAMDAIEILNKKNVDIIITDIRMPQIDGIQLLEYVAKHHPGIIRLILSGQAKKETVLRSIGPMHQYITKPTSRDIILSTIQRSINLRSILRDNTLLGVVSQITTLPSLPKIYHELVKHLEKEEPSISKIAGIISQDIGMVAKILHLINSSFYSLSHHVSDINQAITLLGIDTIRVLVISVHAFSMIKKDVLSQLPLSYLWKHSVNTANISRLISKDQRMDLQDEELSYMGALLHDIGVLILADNFTETYKTIIDESFATKKPFHIIERDVLGVTHAEVGGYLLGIWGLPDPIVETVCYHHEPDKHFSSGFDHVTNVHVANIIDHEMNNFKSPIVSKDLNENYLRECGVFERVDVWRQKVKTMKEKNDDE